MRKIRIQNPTIENTYKTFLDIAYTVGGVSLTVKSNVSFADNDLIVIGNPSEELTELKKINSVSGTTVFNLSSTLNSNHQKETSIYKVVWDQIALEADYGSGFSIITTTAIQWDSKTNETYYYDSNGTDSTNYRFRFYNSITNTYSEYSPTVTGTTPARTSVAFMITEARRIAGDPLRKFVTDDEIIRFFNRAQDIVYAKNPRWWFLYVDTWKGTNVTTSDGVGGIAAVASTKVYSLSNYSNFGHLDSIRYQYLNGNVNILYHLKNISGPEYDARVRNLNKAKIDFVRFYKFLPADSSSTAGYFSVDPVPLNSNIGTFYPNYYKKMTDLSLVSDTTSLPYPSILEDYAIAQILRIKGDLDRAEVFERYFYGPADRAKGIQELTGIALLEEIDDNNKKVQGQPRSLLKWRGQKSMTMLYGENLTASPDYLRETYFDSRTGG